MVVSRVLHMLLISCHCSVCYYTCSYHDGEPKGLQLLNDQDAQLQFSQPLQRAGVDGVIIWGDEEQASGRAGLLQWFKKHSVIFGSSDATTMGSAAANISIHRSHKAVDGFLSRPPIPRNGPIPPYTECGL